MPSYIALLRGINVGGNKKVPMGDLKKVLEKFGATNVKTLLNSGNAMFDVAEKNSAKLTKALEEVLEKKFGFMVPVILRTKEEVQTLIDSHPFKGIPVDAGTRLYVTFLASAPKERVKLPFASEDGSYRILKATESHVISVLQLSDTVKTPDAMNALEKMYGKNVTTRNWNTVQKLVSG